MPAVTPQIAARADSARLLGQEVDGGRPSREFDKGGAKTAADFQVEGPGIEAHAGLDIGYVDIEQQCHYQPRGVS